MKNRKKSLLYYIYCALGEKSGKNGGQNCFDPIFYVSKYFYHKLIYRVWGHKNSYYSSRTKTSKVHHCK